MRIYNVEDVLAAIRRYDHIMVNICEGGQTQLYPAADAAWAAVEKIVGKRIAESIRPEWHEEDWDY